MPGGGARGQIIVHSISGRAIINFARYCIAPDKDWKLLGIYPHLFGLIEYFKF